ncbi:MAG TPA: glycosyltransferase family 4 protein [Phycisphaerales bacterium]|nr:glycosyltransferase family 4 protein [Phycisphaerales bacterium]
MHVGQAGHKKPKTLLLMSQVYVPDPTSVGQHFHDTCVEMVKRGHRVVVLTAAQGYNNPEVRYPKHEVRDGVEIRRFGFSSFGKKRIIFRLAGQLSFLFQSLLYAMFMRNLGGILISTSPPMASAAGLIVSVLHRTPLVFWVMDLNPDQAVAMGTVKASSPLVKLFDFFNRQVLRRSAAIVTLDRFMAERVLRKLDVRDKLTIFPPWPHEGHLEPVRHDENPFRKAHNLNGRFVIMYSGNHSAFTPLRTILDAALRLKDDPRFMFMFIGAGTGKPEVDKTIADHQPGNIISLPYQPMDQIKYSLSAADVHLVSLGDAEVGVRHPCKIYGAMALQRPVLFLGPDPCHVTELIAQHPIGWRIRHGDVDGAVKTIREMADAPREELAQKGKLARKVVDEELSQESLCGRMCDIIERSMK